MGASPLSGRADAAGGAAHVSPPRAAYRLHLCGALPVRAVSELACYLDRLGISHVHSSPLLRGASGSTHRPSVVDPTTIDPDIGTNQDLRGLAATLHGRGMGLILDIAPNHMAATGENPAWNDVLAHGPSSAFAGWFDIDWEYPRSSGPARLLLPVLGESSSLGTARSQPILCYRDGRLRVGYAQHLFPIDPATIPWIFSMGTGQEGECLDPEQADVQEFHAILRTLRQLPPRGTPEPALRRARQSESEEALDRLSRLLERSLLIRHHVDRAVAKFAEARSPALLRRLLDKQCYRLVHGRGGQRQVNYRRVFDGEDLITVRVEDPAVFDATHTLILEWAREGLIDGLAIDHVDSLLDPLTYLERLRSALVQMAGRIPGDVPIYVEKILGSSESLPEGWPIEGITGLDFLNDIEGIFAAPEGISAIEAGLRPMTALWRRKKDFFTLVAEAKRRLLEGELAPDVELLTRRLAAQGQRDSRAADLSARDLRTGVIEVAAYLPVYRTYVDDRKAPVEGFDKATIDTTIAAARRRGRARPAALDLLSRVLLREEVIGLPASQARDQLAFVQLFQQTSVTAMAKGLEDTERTAWVPPISLTEVGGRPARPLADAILAFHLANRARFQRWPGAMICTRTHDTKPSGDVRSRLDVLSEIPEIWTAWVRRWRRLNRRHRRWIAGRLVPDTRTEYLFYQTLVGTWPIPDRGQPPDALPEAHALEGLRERVTEHMRTAARRAKTGTSWMERSRDSRAALEDFICSLIGPRASGESAFVSQVARLVARIRRPGLWNALGKTLVHLTSPGVPDIHQGDESWNFSLTGPGSRAPVDFEHQSALLRNLEASRREAGSLPPPVVRELVEWPEDGRIKLWVTSRTLGLRRDEPSLFSLGHYAPVRVEGARTRHVLTFTRSHDHLSALIVVPRLITGLIDSPEQAPLGARVWRDTCLRLPARLRGRPLRNVLTNSTHVSTKSSGTEFLRLADLLDTFPVALLVTE